MNSQPQLVMIIEDELLLLKAIVKKLEVCGIKTIACAGGHQAFDYLNDNIEIPDAIWLDYYLKDMNGLEIMQKLKANTKWSNIPVIVVSNSASPDKVEHMLGLGVKRYILKADSRLDDIIKSIRELIQT